MAAWELIIYAGAIMVLFLFIIMMLELAPTTETEGPGWQRWVPVLLLSLVVLGCTLVIIYTDPAGSVGRYHASPREFGLVLFVITSYSIHYTKLYERPSTTRSTASRSGAW